MKKERPNYIQKDRKRDRERERIKREMGEIKGNRIKKLSDIK